MVKKTEERKTEERKEVNEEKKDNFKTRVDNYIAVSKLWEDSYLKLYKPWLESTGELFEKALELSKGAAPEKYTEFYEELEENARKTQEVLRGEPDPVKYKEVYDLWIKSYGKIFDDLLTLSFTENIKEIFEKFTGTPEIYSDSFVQISKLWKESYTRLYGQWNGSIQKLYEKSAEISEGNASPEAYKEFYALWLNTYQETYGKLFDIQSAKPSKEIFESFAQSTGIYLNLYKSWITTLEKLSRKAEELSKQTAEPETYKQYYDLWAKTYEKSFDIFFENADIFTGGWTKSSPGPAIST